MHKRNRLQASFFSRVQPCLERRKSRIISVNSCTSSYVCIIAGEIQSFATTVHNVPKYFWVFFKYFCLVSSEARILLARIKVDRNNECILSRFLYWYKWPQYLGRSCRCRYNANYVLFMGISHTDLLYVTLYIITRARH